MPEVEIVVSGDNRADPTAARVQRAWQGVAGSIRRSFTVAAAASRAALRQEMQGAAADMRRSVDAGMQGLVRDSAGRLRDARGRFAAGFKGQALGRGMGKELIGGMASAVLGGGAPLRAALSKAVSTPMVAAVVLGAVAGLGTVLVPALGAVIAGGIVGAITVGLAGAAAAALFHVEEVNKEWSKAEQKRVAESNRQAVKMRKQWLELGRDVVAGLKAAAQPFVPVLDTLREEIRGVGREFAPEIKSGLQEAQGDFQSFIRDLGRGVALLAPAIGPLLGAGGDLLAEFGGMLPGLLGELSTSLSGLATTVSENRDLIALLFATMINLIPIAINMVSGLAGAFRTTLSAAITLGDGFLAVLHGIFNVLSRAPGLQWMSALLPEIEAARLQLGAFKESVDSFPKTLKFEADIRDLEAKIAAAKVQLADPKLTKTRRADLELRIGQLLAAKRAAQREIDTLRGKTVNLTVLYSVRGQRSLRGGTTAFAHGGVVGLQGVRPMATGGVSGSTPALVGEQGPELVRLPYGSSVIPAGQTRSLMSGGPGNGFGSISMAFRHGGDNGSGVAGSLRDIASALRDIVTLREGMEKLTGGIFAQERALQGYEAAWDNVRKSLKENKKTLSIGTEAGRNNRTALLSLAEAAHEVVVAMSNLGKPVSTITKTMAEQRKEFIAAARSMGLTAKQAAALADMYGLIPSKVQTILETERRDTAYNREIEQRQQRATGGPAGGWTLTGEQGPELVRLPYGSSVVPAGRTQSMLAGAGGAQTMVLEIRSGGSRMDNLLVELLRSAIRDRGGNVQTVLGSRR
jgi:uncharacterized protein (DUF697 family)